MAGDVKIQVVPTGYVQGDLSGPPVFERLSDRLDEVGNSVKAIADRMRTSLGGLLQDQPDQGWQLDEVSFQFALQLEAEAGVIVAKATTAAGFEVNLAWKRTPSET